MEHTNPTNAVHCTVVTPERTVLDAAADFVAVPMYDGELGVMPGRAPMIGRVGYGELRTRKGDEIRRLYVDGGFVQVRSNTVTVLTSRAVPVEQIDVTKAQAEVAAAHTPAETVEARDAQQSAAAKARVQLRLAAAERERYEASL